MYHLDVFVPYWAIITLFLTLGMMLTITILELSFYIKDHYKIVKKKVKKND